jgi:hypothetical protein
MVSAETLRYFTTKTAIFIGTLGAIFIGLHLAQTKNLLESFAGAFLVVSAVQIALWILGIRLEILANKPVQDHVRAEEFPDKHMAETALDERLPLLEGRLISLLGYVLGEASMKPGSSFEPSDRDRLEQAVSLCQKGYGLLRHIEGPAKYMALNNLVYYSSIAKDELRRGYILSSARELRSAGMERSDVNILLTACRAILQFSGDELERREALDILRQVKEFGKTTNRERKEAEDYLEHFSN